jgi:hypothetical protein
VCLDILMKLLIAFCSLPLLASVALAQKALPLAHVHVDPSPFIEA